MKKIFKFKSKKTNEIVFTKFNHYLKNKEFELISTSYKIGNFLIIKNNLPIIEIQKMEEK